MLLISVDAFPYATLRYAMLLCHIRILLGEEGGGCLLQTCSRGRSQSFWAVSRTRIPHRHSTYRNGSDSVQQSKNLLALVMHHDPRASGYRDRNRCTDHPPTFLIQPLLPGRYWTPMLHKGFAVGGRGGEGGAGCWSQPTFTKSSNHANLQ
jgi:hypothetical protein